MAKQTNKTAHIKIDRIEVVSFSFVKKPTEITGPIDYTIGFTSNIKVHAKDKLLVYHNVITVTLKESDKLLSTLEMRMGFVIDNFDEFVHKKSDKIYDVNLDLQKNLAAVCLNTIRGTQGAYLNGTYLGKVVLPLIDIDHIQREEKEE